MRPSIVVALLLLGSTPAIADSSTTGSGGGGGGGGRLSQVSSGIGSASQGSSSSSGSSSGYYYDDDYDCNHTAYWRDHRCADERALATGHPTTTVVATSPPSIARVEGYVGAQKVHESDGSLSLEVGIVDRHFRLDGAVSHYFEGQMDGGQITMTMPSLTAGFRIQTDDGPGAWLEVGAVNARTNGDPMGNSSIYGPVVRTRFEHAMSPRSSLFGAAEAMFFQHDIRAYGGRAGVRIGRVQASLRVLDFNVGPALYGPEIGLRF
jgi:hypothetical protein